MKHRVWVAVLGFVVVAVYATAMALQALVLDPLAAVPGSTLDEIHARLEASGMDVGADNRNVILSAIVGVALAVATAMIGIWQCLPALVMSLIFLAIVALGGFVTYGAGFALGMDVADTYGGSGGDHTMWAGVLYIASLTAFLGALVVTVKLVRDTRSPQPGY